LGGGRESSVSVLLCLTLADEEGLRGMLLKSRWLCCGGCDDAQRGTFSKHVIR